MMYIKGVSFLKNLEKSSPVNQHRLWALLRCFYDHSGLPGSQRTSGDVPDHSPRPLGQAAALPVATPASERIPRVGPVLPPGDRNLKISRFLKTHDFFEKSSKIIPKPSKNIEKSSLNPLKIIEKSSPNPRKTSKTHP